MKNLRENVLTVATLAVTLFITSCKEKGDASTDTKLVKNPATADSIIATPDDLPQMTFEYDTWDFQEIIKEEVVSHNFKFTNTGKTDLLITSARASCGCTVPEYPKEPVKPGDFGIIKVTYNSDKANGAFNKTVYITANTYPNENKLHVKGIVITPGDK